MALARRIPRAVACTLAAISLCLAFGATPSFAADSPVTAHNLETNAAAIDVSPGETFGLEAALPADSASGTNVYIATLDYDPATWKDPSASDFKCAGTWTSAVYNPVNHKFAVVSTGEPAPGEKVFALNMTVRSDAKPGTANVSIVNIQTSDGVSDAKAVATSHAMNIVAAPNSDSKDPDPATANNPTNPSSPAQEATPTNTNLGTSGTSSGGLLVKTSDSASAKLILALAIAAIIATTIISLAAFDRRKSRHTRTFSIFTVALVACVATSGLASTAAFAVEYDAQKDLDSNGRVDMTDVRLMEEIIVGLTPATRDADLTGDGAITATDLSILLGGVGATDNASNDKPSTPGANTPGAGSETTDPSMPNTPEVPDSPTNPGTPATPGTPTTPDTPSEPTNPDTPSEPNMPDTPTTPTPDLTLPDTTFRGLTFTQIEPTNDPVTFEPLIFQNEQMKAYGTTGAGSQWPVSLETSRSGDLMLYGIDVAGLYRSTDHGKTWSRANSGIDARGVAMFAIDPRNESHVLALGLGLNRTVGGIYLSENGADTWRETFPIAIEGARYLWDGLEFDPTSYDAARGICTDAYFSVPYDRDSTKRENPTSKPAKLNSLTEAQAGIYLSGDGGRTFSLLVNDRRLADGIVRIADDGRVFVGNQHGLFRVGRDGTFETFAQFANDGDTDFAKGVTGLDVVGNTVYAQTWDGIYALASDAAPTATVASIAGATYKSTNWPQFLSVSKSNPRHMVYMFRSDVTNYYVARTHVSDDGGATWREAEYATNSSFYKASWNGREKSYVIDPSDDSRVVTFGSDSLAVSEDGGHSFVQASGISNMMLGGRLNFNQYSPDTYLMAAQDYAGAFTHDGGATFEPVENLGKGNMYGGFAADRYTFMGFAGKTWGTGSLTVSHDGGGTWTDTGLSLRSGVAASSMQSPSNPDVLFAGDNYSKDRGRTWQKMKNCINVHTFDYTGERDLYGENASGNVVVSRDNGDTWTNVTTGLLSGRPSKPTEHIIDMSLDQVNRWLYIVLGLTGSTGNTDQVAVRLDLRTLETRVLNVPLDRTIGWAALKAIEVDPNSTGVVYACMSGGYFCAPTALVRSVDGGETWRVLTTSNKEEWPSHATNQGGYEVSDLAIDPYTGNLYASGGCYGSWVVAPPYDQSLLHHERPQAHTIKYVYDGRVVHTAQVANNDRHSYALDVPGVALVDWYRDAACTQAFSNGSFVYESMVLYAKVRPSCQVTLVSEGRAWRTIDADKFDAGDAGLIPEREGYAFAGWFGDEALTELVDFAEMSAAGAAGPTAAVAYAGWYRILADAFDPAAKDTHNYIGREDHKVQDMALVDHGVAANNRSLLLNVDKQSHYYVSFKMSTRFRLGMRTGTIWPYNPVTTCWVDPRDVGGNDAVDEYVVKTVDTGENVRMMITYYNYRCGVEYEEIRDTFRIYKIESGVPVL